MIDAIGWFGSALVVVSLTQASMTRLRVINLIACLILVGYSAAIGSWPMVTMNAIVALINVHHLVRARTGRAATTRRPPVRSNSPN